MLVVLGILSIIGGVATIALSTVAFGDIGVAIAIGGIALFMIGLITLIINGRLKKIEKVINHK